MLRILMALAAFAAAPLAVAAQDYPTHPISVIVPFPAGGPSDVIVRMIQAKMEAELGQPLVIDNRPGATGNIGSAFAAKAAPDGYTILIQATNIGMFPHVFASMTYDPRKDLAVIGSIAEYPNIFTVNQLSPIQSFSDLMTRAKASPGSIRYGTPGVGSPGELTTELLSDRNGVRLTHVPYRGALPAVNDLLGNFIDCTTVGAPVVLPFVKDGRLRGLAVTSAKRYSPLPDIPTIKELGFGNIDEGARYVLFAPAATPKPILDRLSKALASALSVPAIKDGFTVAGFELSGTTAAEVKEQIQQQYELWGPIVKKLDLKFD